MIVTCKQVPEPSASEDAEIKSHNERHVLCSNCLNPVASPDDQIIVNQSFRHTFANPHGYVYEVGCFSRAGGCRPGSTPSGEFSWFPGYVWQVGVCKGCSIHLGWKFSSATDSFFGLIIDHLIFPKN